MPFFDIFAFPRWSPLRMRTKVASFFIFFQELSNKKKIKALRPKMTKIASRGGPALTSVRPRRQLSGGFLWSWSTFKSIWLHLANDALLQKCIRRYGGSQDWNLRHGRRCSLLLGMCYRTSFAGAEIDHIRISPPSLFSSSHNQSTWMFTQSLIQELIGRGVYICCMTSLCKWSIGMYQ